MPAIEGGVRTILLHGNQLLLGTTANSIMSAALAGAALRNPLSGVRVDKEYVTQVGLSTRQRPSLLCACVRVVRCALCVVRCALCVVRCALCVVRCALCVVRCALCVVRCALCVVRCALCVVRCAVCVVRCALCGVRCAVCVARCAVRGARCAVRGARCAVRGARCAVRGVRCAVRGACACVIILPERLIEESHLSSFFSGIDQATWLSSQSPSLPSSFRLFQGHSDDVQGICTIYDSPKAGHIVTAGWDGSVCAYDTDKRKPVWKWNFKVTRMYYCHLYQLCGSYYFK